MSQPIPFPFIGGAYLSRSRKLGAQRCVNFYLAKHENGQLALFGTPGLRKLATLTGGGIRGMHVPTSGNAIVVCGPYVYRVAADWSAVKVGTIDNLGTPVSIDDDGTTAVLVTGPNGYTLNLGSNAFAQITDEAFYGADYVYYNKTVFVFNRPNTADFYTTEVQNGVTFDALDFGRATSNAEPIVRHIVSREEILLFKQTVTEVWRAVAGGDFLFARDTNVSIPKGCEAKHSVASVDGTVFWLGGDEAGGGTVWKLDGYTPVPVSHDGLEYAIQGYATTADAWAYSYKQEGHPFYVLNFPTAGATWSYDTATGEWHERAYLDMSTGDFDRHRGACHMKYGGVHVVGDWQDGRLYALDPNCYDDDGAPLVSLRSCAHMGAASGNEVRFNRLRLDLETGVGTESGQGVDPVLMLRWSNNGGATWSALKSLSMGKLGEYSRRVSIDRLGVARDRVFEVSISDPVRRVIVAAAVDAVELSR